MKYDVDARKDPYCNVSDFFELPKPPDVEQAPLNNALGLGNSMKGMKSMKKASELTTANPWFHG